ncbi:MAG TPA: NAD(P)/FAD-dependent oxidoreductase [Rhizomicrobium sp.]|jgi:phytoene dehydrogenase-like protein|nr:NAD(P)/FAD-dependent oxidoreductase [Rhizomicrobium sp.]
MNGEARYDAVVIGAGVGGLVAASLLARARRSVLLLEAQDAPGGACRASEALGGAVSLCGPSAVDARVVKTLRLARRGLKLARRPAAVAALRPDGRRLLIDGEGRAPRRAIAAQSLADAGAIAAHRAELARLGRRLSPLWLERAGARGEADDDPLLARLKVTSAAAVLNARFESEAVKTALAFDAPSPFDSGSAMALVWRAAEAMGRQGGAAAIAEGGAATLAQALADAALSFGVELRLQAKAAELILADGAVVGVALDSGERIFARAVLSSLSRRTTLLKLCPTARAGLAETFALIDAAPVCGEASIGFLLNGPAGLGGGDVPAGARFVLADRLDSFAAAASAARAGRLPDDLILEAASPSAIEPSVAPQGRHVLIVRARCLPVHPAEGWAKASTALIAGALAALERHAPNLRARIVGVDLALPDGEADADGGPARLLASYDERIATPIEGLFLCGAGAEPMNDLLGRAARLAASIALDWLAKGSAS